MRRWGIIMACVTFAMPAVALAQQVVMPPSGRYQIVVSTGQVGGLFLLDTSSGCVWSAVQDPETKRPAFIEVEVQNLHWGLTSQQLLMSRIDASTELNPDQKRALKSELDRTRCGAFSVLLTPGPVPGGAPAPPAGPSSGPTKSPTRR